MMEEWRLDIEYIATHINNNKKLLSSLGERKRE